MVRKNDRRDAIFPQPRRKSMAQLDVVFYLPMVTPPPSLAVRSAGNHRRSTRAAARDTLCSGNAMAAVLHPFSWQRMSNAVDHVRRRLLRASAVLREAGIPYAVVGGNAVAAWVARVDEAAVRNTRDVNLLLRREDLPAAIEAMERAGFTHRRVASIGRAGAMEVFLESPDGRIVDAVHILFANEKARPDQPEPNAGIDESEEADDYRVISLEALVRMKLSAFRDKDRVHLRDLAAVGLIDAKWPARFGSELRSRLEQILDTPEG